MLAKKSKSSLRLGLVLAFIAILTLSCFSPTATLPAQSSLIPAAEYPTPQPSPPVTVTVDIGPTQISPNDGMVMVYVPAGEFLMGSDKVKDNQAEKNELPQHTVYLDAFWIDQTEVTNTMYGWCVKDQFCPLPPSSSSEKRLSYFGNSKFANYPVVNVLWSDAQTYCSWVGRCLPSKAEWEKAARGTDGRIYPWGDVIDCAHANYHGCTGDTTAVGSYPAGASPYGALDMAGIVEEWVADWYDAAYYRNSPARNPTGPSSGGQRVFRGGSFLQYDFAVRSAWRVGEFPHDPGTLHGFRCASSP